MTIEEIKELLRIFNESGVGELELQRGKDLLRIRKSADPAATAPVVLPAGLVPPAAAMAPASAEPKPGGGEAAASNETLVTSPIVGTFYEAPAKDAPAFVKVGDFVEKGQVLCIVESMKLMNEIEAEVAGVITAKLVENGRPVEYGTALFSIRPR